MTFSVRAGGFYLCVIHTGCLNIIIIGVWLDLLCMTVSEDLIFWSERVSPRQEMQGLIFFSHS